MKNLAEQVAELKRKEKEAYTRFDEARTKEVNAILKRLGDETGCTSYIMMKAYEDAKKEGKALTECDPVVLAYALVSKYPYICKLCDKWYSLWSQLTIIEKSLKD